MYIYKYEIDGDIYEIEQKTKLCEVFYDILAEECAEKEFSDSAGECSFTMVIELFDDDKSLGVYTIEMEYEPRFTAWKTD
jgi:hypothetical protein